MLTEKSTWSNCQTREALGLKNCLCPSSCQKHSRWISWGESQTKYESDRISVKEYTSIASSRGCQSPLELDHSKHSDPNSYTNPTRTTSISNHRQKEKSNIFLSNLIQPRTHRSISSVSWNSSMGISPNTSSA